MTDILIHSKAAPLRDRKYSRDVEILVVVALAAVILAALLVASVQGTSSSELVLAYPPF